MRLLALAAGLLSWSLAVSQTLACRTGYRVEEAPTATAATWTLVSNLAADASMVVVTPGRSGAHFYRVAMLMSDGTVVNSMPIPVTVIGKPGPPLNLKLLFASTLPNFDWK